MFPEGTTTNGSGLMKFKKGAFLAEVPVQPCFFTWKRYGPVSLADDIAEPLNLCALLFSSFSLNLLELHIMPVFAPNEYLFETYVHTINKNEIHSEMPRW